MEFTKKKQVLIKKGQEYGYVLVSDITEFFDDEIFKTLEQEIR